MSTTADVAWLIIFAVAVALFVADPDFAQGNVRRRMDRFGRRERLMITPANEPIVADYLVRTRRWRYAVFLAAAVISGTTAIVTHTTASPLWLPAGWFAGVALAEWRITGRAAGVRAAALLRPRRISDHVGRAVLSAILGVWVLVLILATAGLFAASAHRPFQRTGESVVLGLALLAFPAFTFAAQRIVSRPQPLAQRDVIDADNAIRRRSLNVFAGSLLASGGLLVTTAVIAGLAPRASQIANLTILVFGFGLPIVGVVLAMTSRRPFALGTPRAVNA